MTVHRHRHIFDALHILTQIGYQCAHFRRSCVADRIGDVHRCRARRNRALEHAAQELAVATGSVLGGKFHVGTIFFSVPHHFNHLLVHFVGRFFKLVFHMNGRGRQKDVEPRILGEFDCAPRAVDILRQCPRKAGDCRVSNFFRDQFYRVEIALRRRGETRLDDVNMHCFKLTRDLDLFGIVHAAARRLFAVAQRGIKDLYISHFIPR